MNRFLTVLAVSLCFQVTFSHQIIASDGSTRGAAPPISCDQAPDATWSPSRLGEYEIRCRYQEARPQYFSAALSQIYRAWDRINPKDLNLQSYRKELLERYGLFYEPGAQLPIGLNRTYAKYRKPAMGEDGKLSVWRTLHNPEAPGLTVNCMSCHAAILPSTVDGEGQIAIGIGNVFLDLQRFHEDMKKVEGSPPGLTIQRNPPRNSIVNSADFFGVVASYLRRDYPTINSNGEMFPIFATNNIKDEHVQKLAGLAFTQPYLKTQPWTSFKYKAPHGLYVDGGFSGNPAAVTYRLAFSRNRNGDDYLDNVERFEKIGPAYFESLTPPVYPFPINHELATKGKKLYAQNCAQCHGSFSNTNQGDYQLQFPGRVIDVGTDSHRFDYFTKRHSAESFSNDKKQELKIEYNNGYVAPPLVGIWARAPYLHNGSVPNIRQLLSEPKNRTRRYALFPTPTKHENFDQKNLGWRFIDLDQTPVANNDSNLRTFDPDWTINEKWLKQCKAKDSQAKHCTEQITVKGLSNKGHDLKELIGEYFNAEELNALLEFLKTL